MYVIAGTKNSRRDQRYKFPKDGFEDNCLKYLFKEKSQVYLEPDKR